MINNRLQVLKLFGAALKEKRMELGISQVELADRSCLDRTYISMLETGKRNPSLINLIRLSASLEITISELLGNL